MREISSYHESALALHRRITVIDGHADTLTLAVDEGHQLVAGGTGNHIDVPRLEAAGVGVQTLTCWNEPHLIGHAAFARAMEKIGAFYQAQRQGGLRQVKSRADLEAPGLGFILSLEDAAPCMGSVRHLEALYAAGVRMIGLTWNGRNEIADGVLVGDKPGGLTKVGQVMVMAMEELGIVIDLSHIAEIGFWDVVEATEKPLACSHSNAKAVHEHPRNLTDAQIKAIADRGGVIGVCFAPAFLGPGEPGIEEVVRHIDHMCELAGPEVVGLGSDFDGIAKVPVGLEDVSKLPALTAALLARGYREDDLVKILGGNWKRVFSACWSQ
ncbi:MAG: dipeptidase [Candidatus Sericytochromatia bacterium]